ncbi:L,D-transpeptidase [Polaromonas sp. LjRoot131]|uniref:L,D-transpeptidase n=1 Tax=Polaromonas sp. LjRoot131 TaxID=3342262 RepID=UPI003ECDAE65
MRPLKRATATAFLLAFHGAQAQDMQAGGDLAAAFRAEVDRRLEVPAAEFAGYGRLAESALAEAGIVLQGPQYIMVVDRHPYVQASFLMLRSVVGEWSSIGATPVSTGMPGSFDHFETPLGVFAHSLANPDFRAEGTLNANGIRGYGARGMRVFDFGWQRVPKGWGDGKVMEMRLQMHATDPDVLEQRLGSAQSKGCIRIPATLNTFLDRRGILDADYQQSVREGRQLWVLRPDRQPVPEPGRYLVVVESTREDRPLWSPPPFLPHRKAAPLPHE